MTYDRLGINDALLQFESDLGNRSSLVNSSETRIVAQKAHW